MSEESETEAMGLARFAAILGAYGAEARRWPAAERDAAERLLAASAEARALRHRSEALDAMLNASPTPSPSPALRAAILRAAPGGRPAPRRGGLLRGLWVTAVAALAGELGGLRPAGALVAVALLLGVVAGGAVGIDAETEIAGGSGVDVVHLALLDEQFSGY